jgi:hypothetical protein
LLRVSLQITMREVARWKIVTPAPRGYCQIPWLGNMRVAVGKDEGKEVEGGADREEKSRIGRKRRTLAYD